MPSVLILCAHRPRRSPSQRYRFEQYLPYLEQNGFKFTWSYLLDEKDDAVFYSPGNAFSKVLILLKTLMKREKDTKRFGRFDIIFIQREASFTGSSRYEKKAAVSGASVIFDFDDSIWLPDTSPGNRRWQWIKKPGKFFDNVKYARLVIAGNDYLSAKASGINKHTRVIPTTIDTEIHIAKPQMRGGATLIIGWSGSISTLKHFESLLPVLVRVKEKYGDKVAFKIIGNKNYHSSQLDVQALDWNEKTEVDELNSFDIGIMPLPDNEWTKGKCGLKGLSYMACEVPAVMSNVGVNAEIIINGHNGLLVNDDAEWFEALCRLVDDKGLRKQLGKEGRRTVIGKYSVEANKDKYLETFKNAASSR